MTVFDMLRSQLRRCYLRRPSASPSNPSSTDLAIEALTTTIQAQVSLDRVDDFLRNVSMTEDDVIV